MEQISEYLTEQGGKWRARLVYREGGQRRESTKVLGAVHRGRGRPVRGALSETAAWARVGELRAELERDLGLDVEQREQRAAVTFELLALAWLEDAGRSTGRPWAPSTHRDYHSALGLAENRRSDGYILPTLGALTLSELTANRLRAWWRGLKLTPRNRNKQLTIVRRIFAWANEDGRWGRIEDPTVGIRKDSEPDVSGEAPRFLELEEIDRLCVAADEEYERERRDRNRRGHDHVSRHDSAIFELMAQTGMRRAEVIALRVGDVDLANRSLTVRHNVSAGAEHVTKGRRAMRLLLSDRALAVLKPRVDGRALNEYVFATLKGGRLDPDALSRRFLRAAKRAGLPRVFTLHDLRHSTGSLLARAGYSQTEIQHMLRHAKSSTTERYMHYRPRAGDAERLSRALDTPSPDQLRAVG
jgi:integrase/recombinase XerC